MDIWRIIHLLCIVWLSAGLGSTIPLIIRAWLTNDVQNQMYCLAEAAQNETRILLPGAMATGISGFFWGIAAEYHFLRDGWLLAMTILFVFCFLLCLPLLGVGLRRARTASLVAAKQGKVTKELREVLDDRVPLVFGALLVLAMPLFIVFAVFKPF